MIQDRPPRPYSRTKRDAKAAETRERLLQAALALLRGPGNEGFSLDAVATTAGVTRLTVYNQFGSRKGLLEAAFDALAVAGGMNDLASAMAIADPQVGLAQLVMVFCRFWSSDDALAELYAAAAIDKELANSLAARNERRRKALTVLVRRQGGRDEQCQRDVVDTLFALTSYPMFQMLNSTERNADAICAMIQPLCEHVLAGK